MSGEQDGGTFGFIAVAAACAVSLGLGVITATVIGVDALRPGEPAGVSPALYVLFGGTLAGILAAAGTAWWLLRPIQSTYRRGGLALVSGFATVLLMLVCIPVHQLFGRGGLVTLLGLSAVAAAFLFRRARRFGAHP